MSETFEKKLGRRKFVSTSLASTAASSMGACIRRPKEKILPYSVQPEYVVPGVPLHYATVLEEPGDALGLLVRTFEGRPTKVEGHPEHPSSRGRAMARTQACIQELYDPDRSRYAFRQERGERIRLNRRQVGAYLEELHRRAAEDQGAGVAVLCPPSRSLSMDRLQRMLNEKLPRAMLARYASFDDAQAQRGLNQAFGAATAPRFRFEEADVIVALDSDFLATEAGATAHAHAFGARRRWNPGSPRPPVRLYAIESQLSLTGAQADHRLALPSPEIVFFLCEWILELLSQKALPLHEVAEYFSKLAPHTFFRAEAPMFRELRHFVRALSVDTLLRRGRVAVVTGRGQPPIVHALTGALQRALDTPLQPMDSVGHAVSWVDPTWMMPAGHVPSLKEPGLGELTALVERLAAGEIQQLVILGGNPAWTAPADAHLIELMRQPHIEVLHCGTHVNETSLHADIHVPLTHPFEAWGDAISRDGVYAIRQPLIRPLFHGLSELEVLARLAGVRNGRGRSIVRRSFRRLRRRGGSIDQPFRYALQRGLVRGTRLRNRQNPEVQWASLADRLDREIPQLLAHRASGLSASFSIDARFFSSASENNPWLLELPDPITKLCWDNAALIGPKTARAWQLQTGDQVEVALEEVNQTVRAPVLIQAGQAEGVITLPLYGGRTTAGRYGNGVGISVRCLRQGEGMYTAASEVQLRRTSERVSLVRTQQVDVDMGRPLALLASHSSTMPRGSSYAGLPVERMEPEFAGYLSVEPTTKPLFDRGSMENESEIQWGMTIDLSACTGCSACVIACQAENNIPVVGKEEVQKGRAMHWIRVDRYLSSGSFGDVCVRFMPVACQHCEHAPCEQVCPVNATNHSPEGLNQMTYNRCVGTRYCAANCPYMVRSFNFKDWRGTDKLGELSELGQMQFNPNVTVRERGVVEKCTFCVQRIEEERTRAKLRGQPFDPDRVTPACVQTCPSNAMAFGNLSDAQSRAGTEAGSPRAYRLLSQLGTRPRVSYLAAVRNPDASVYGIHKDGTAGLRRQGEHSPQPKKKRPEKSKPDAPKR
ncbi:MAG: 4Fe-4S dicluster domain-containing protein [Myxococcota bacterium]